MTQFKVGDRVRCVDNKTQTGLLTVGAEYVITSISDDGRFIRWDGRKYGSEASRFVPAEPAGMAAACREEADTGDYDRWSFDWPGISTAMSGGPGSGIPSTARAILDMVPEKKTPPLTEKQQQQGEAIQRAVANLSRRDNAYMPCAKDWGT